MGDAYMTVKAVPAARHFIPKRIGFRRVPHVVEKVTGLEVRVTPLLGSIMHCEATSVARHSIRASGKRAVNAWTKDAASTITVEASVGVTVEVPVFYAATCNSAHASESTEMHAAKMYADLSSVCSQDSTFLRNLDTGELLQPQPWTVVSAGSETGVRHASKGRRKRVVKLPDRSGRYQIVTVAVKRAAVVRRSGADKEKEGH
ncbi:uncharacterized protein Tco025E_04062 [Trypanosoma conorhini]|uniref:Uncharacterized protein n=1 Tax=Trypanosoma conorhini TaxID=83891 RepID=A0A422PQ02_9TRYP|nr:uncharacterized protein Tco025E_04062 [Trypanosoma conorhini]RNF19823.1 hypothetical protein Tco025E_04062 [Trypanosoma conorhini]